MYHRSETQLYMLGGRATPNRIHRYKINNDAWDLVPQTMPFDFVHGACVALQLKGKELYTF